jgi:short subunit dehydrogenase-like uncharacterized protein
MNAHKLGEVLNRLRRFLRRDPDTQDPYARVRVTAWVRDLIDRYHERAAGQGTRVVPFCGFDSAPADLGVSILAQQLGSSIAEVRAYFEMKGSKPNGGTVATGLSTYDSGAAERMRDPFLLSPEMKCALHPIEKDRTVANYDKEVGCWVAPLPMSVIDTRVVRRSCSLMGLDMAFQEYTIIRGKFAPLRAAALAAGTALLSAAMHFTSFRDMARKSALSGWTVSRRDGERMVSLPDGGARSKRACSGGPNARQRRSCESNHGEVCLRERPRLGLRF